MTFGRIPGSPELFVLDSTDPAQIRATERRIDVANTLFIVSSKSGTTLEPNIFMQYFLDRARRLVGADRAGTRFVAITDPGSKLDQVAAAERFRRVLGGRSGSGRCGGGARARRPARRAERRWRSLRARRRVLPLGDRDGRRGLDPRRQSVRSARRRGEQGRDARVDRALRDDRSLA